jgi:hypothetical protein
MFSIINNFFASFLEIYFNENIQKHTSNYHVLIFLIGIILFYNLRQINYFVKLTHNYKISDSNTNNKDIKFNYIEIFN